MRSHCGERYTFTRRRFFAGIIQITKQTPTSNARFNAKAIYRGGWGHNDLVDDTTKVFEIRPIDVEAMLNSTIKFGCHRIELSAESNKFEIAGFSACWTKKRKCPAEKRAERREIFSSTLSTIGPGRIQLLVRY